MALGLTIASFARSDGGQVIQVIVRSGRLRCSDAEWARRESRPSIGSVARCATRRSRPRRDGRPCRPRRSPVRHPAAEALLHADRAVAARDHARGLAVIDALSANSCEQGERASLGIDMLAGDDEVMVVGPDGCGRKRRGTSVAPVDFAAHVLDVVPFARVVLPDLPETGTPTAAVARSKSTDGRSLHPVSATTRFEGVIVAALDLLALDAATVHDVHAAGNERSDQESESETSHDRTALAIATCPDCRRSRSGSRRSPGCRRR